MAKKKPESVNEEVNENSVLESAPESSDESTNEKVNENSGLESAPELSDESTNETASTDEVELVKKYELKDNRIYIEGVGTIEKKDFTNEHYDIMCAKYGEATALKYVK